MGAAKHRPESWSSWIDPWSEWMRAAGCADSTIEYRRSRLYAFARHAGDDPRAAGERDILSWLDRQEAGPNTTRLDQGVLRSFFGWASGHGLTDDPTRGLPAIARVVTAENVASEEAMALGRSHWDQRSRMMVSLAGDAGLRRTEIAALRGDDLARDDDGWLLAIPGQGARRRVIPITDRLGDAISARGNGYTFPGEKGLEHVCADTVWRVIRDATGCSPTELRRRFAATALRESGGDYAAVAGLMGVADAQALRRFVGDEPSHDLRSLMMTVRG